MITRTEYETTVKFTVVDLDKRLFIDTEKTFVGKFDTTEKLEKLHHEYEKETKKTASAFEVVKIVATLREMTDEVWIDKSTVRESRTVYEKPATETK